MSIIQLLLVFAPALLMLSGCLLPRKLANGKVDRLRSFVAWLSGIQCIAAIAVLAALLPQLLQGNEATTIDLLSSIASLHIDGFSLLMLSLVSFVGFVVCRYSVRYLDGDENQGNYFRWVATTIGAVSLFVISGNLLMMFLAWLLTSFGLHQLLVHYSQRPAARSAAWTKFTVSRVGDALFLAAIALIYRDFGTFELAEIFAALKVGTVSCSPAIAWLVILAAATKSAQFPVHSWLPNTLESPTPVSALMHAGIVNAGGYVVIRLSPVLTETPAALGFLAIIGSITVCYAAIVMMTQTSIKRSLAYSTIAQMGFMMLQCGFGAFSAAMLHILAHSLYKAYAFLNSGSVLTEASGRRRPTAEQGRKLLNVDLIGGFVLAGVAVLFSSLILGVNLGTKPGGFALGFILTLALATWLWDVFRLDSIRATLAGLVTAAGLALLYMTGYFVIDQVVAASLPSVEPSLMQTIAMTDTFVVFCALIGVNWMLSTDRGRQILAPMYVHAANGFYIEAWTQRLLAVARK